MSGLLADLTLLDQFPELREWPAERFRQHGITYEPAPKPKSDLYQALLPALNSRRIDLVDDARLINQLCLLERRTSRGGRDSIDHPPNAHDDVCNAVAGLWVIAQRPSYLPPTEWVGGDEGPDERAAFRRREMYAHIMAGSRPQMWRSPYWR